MQGDLAGSFLAIAPHFTIHREDADRFLLFSENRSLRLRGEVYRHLLPLLTGEYTGEQIAGMFQSPEVPAILERLFGEGQVVIAPPGRDISRQAYWSALGRAPEATEAALQQFRVAVQSLGAFAGTGSGGAGAMLASLAGSGLAVTEPVTADLTVVLVDDYLDPAMRRFGDDAQSGRRWLPFKPGGERALIGPVMGGEDGGCLHCLTRRMSEHRSNDALLGHAPRALRPARGWLTASLEMARATAALEITRLAVGEDTAIQGHVIDVNTWAGTRRVHRHWTYPDCPACGPGASLSAGAGQPIRLGNDTVVDAEIGGWRTLSQEQALARLEPLVSDITGIITDVRPSPELEHGLYVYNAVQVTQSHADHMQNRRLGRPGSASGKGLTAAQARVSCLAEAVERYCCGWVGTVPRRRGRLADLGDDAIHPHRLLNFSDYQYDNREALNGQSGPLHYISRRFDETAEIEWTPVWSLTHETVRWVPTRACYFDYRAAGVPGDHDFCIADSNGCASGATLQEAILQGMLEVVERDAVAIWWYNRIQRPGISLEGIHDAFVERMLKRYDQKNRSVRLLDLTVDNGIPVVAAVSAMKQTGGRILMGFGAHMSPRIAAERALTELNQLILFDEPGEAEKSKDQLGDDLANWLQAATLTDHPYLAPAGDAVRRVDAMAQPGAASIDGAIALARDRFAELGLEMMVLDYGRTDMPLATVKVFVPGMRHFWGRRGPGRLYDVPVQLGWQAAANAETALNPVNFFF